MVHCRSPTKCLKNGHFPSNQIQIVPDSNCCKLCMDNGLPAGANFSPDTSDAEYEEVMRRPKCNRSAMIIDHALRAIRQNGFWVNPSERMHAGSDPDDDILL